MVFANISNRNADDFSDKVNTTCASIRELLSAKDDLPTYVNSILTAYLCQQPPDYENALRLLATFRSRFHIYSHTVVLKAI